MKRAKHTSSLITVFTFFMLAAVSTLSRATDSDKSDESNVAEAFRPKGKIFFEVINYDFGQILRGEKVLYSFKFTNIGKGPLVIHGVHAACGCTAVSKQSERPYAPGEQGSIDVSFESENFDGRIHKTISVMTNEIEKSSRLLSLSGTVKSQFVVNPPLADFGSVWSQSENSKMLSVKFEKDAALDLTKAKLNTSMFKLDYIQSPLPGVQELRVVLLPGLKPGFYKENVLIPISGAKLSEVRIPVRVNILPNATFSSNYVEFGAVNSGDASKRQVSVESKNSIKILSHKLELMVNNEKLQNPESFVELAGPQILENLSKTNLTINLKHPGNNKSGSVHGKLTLLIDDPLQKEMSLDLYGFFK